MSSSSVVEAGPLEASPQGAMEQDNRAHGRLVETLVVGAGPTGMRVAQRLAEAGQGVVVFNAEPFEPYNRVKLTPLLSGDVQIGQIGLKDEGSAGPHPTVLTGMRVMRIDRQGRQVVTADGGVWPYKTLVLATGSRAFVPNIPGRDLPNVYSFRDADDVSALIARSFSARRVVVIGGGLLGLEAARGMRQRGAEVSVVEHENRLMPRQLDERAADVLKARIAGLGVAVRTGVAVGQIVGNHRVEAVELRNGERIPCDTVIICTGVRANIGVAQEAGLGHNRGVLVNDRMRTSDANIYAVGECAEHAGLVYGLVGPGLEQADAAAAAILGSPKGAYQGSTPATKLKVIGADVFSIGEVERLELEPNTRSHVWSDGQSYRRIFVTRGRLTGALAVGEWPEASKTQQAAVARSLVFPWQIYRFRRSGSIWPATEGEVEAIPAQAVVCNCTGVTAGRLRACMSDGAKTVEALKSATGASSVCGTCKPLIEELIEAGAPPKPVRLFKPILAMSAFAALLALVTLLAPRIPTPGTYLFDGPAWTERLWFDNITKQWTGYILLGVSVAALILGLRKRIKLLRRWGGYDWWRIAHLVIGGLALIGLFAHTGFRPGENLNLWLFLSFSATLLFGAVAGLATGGEHKLREQGLGTAKTPPRTLPTWLHILAIWPLPALLLAHVVVTYVY